MDGIEIGNLEEANKRYADARLVEQNKQFRTEVEKLREALEIVQKCYSLAFKNHQRKHKDAPEPSLCVWCRVDQALQKKGE